MTQSLPLAIVAGAGSGLGEVLLQHFKNHGYQVVGLNRSSSANTAFDIRVVDLTDEAATNDVITTLINEYGIPKVVIHNTAQLIIKPLTDTMTDDFEACWRSMALSAFVLAKSLMQPMSDNGGGTFIISGATASLRGSAKFSAFSSAKFALRGLTQSLAREYQPQGVHVVHSILDGIIDTENSRSLHSMDPNKMMKPEDIAEVYFSLCLQPKSTWTHECDLRPFDGNF